MVRIEKLFEIRYFFFFFRCEMRKNGGQERLAMKIPTEKDGRKNLSLLSIYLLLAAEYFTTCWHSCTIFQNHN